MLKVIIADDDPFMRQAFKSIIKVLPDVQVISEARDGQELVQKVLELSPDLILLDIDMPKMNGIEAAQEIVKINSEAFIIFKYFMTTKMTFSTRNVPFQTKPIEREGKYP